MNFRIMYTAFVERGCSPFTRVHKVMPKFKVANTIPFQYVSDAYLQTTRIYIATTPEYPVITGTLYYGSLCYSGVYIPVAHPVADSVVPL